jgi:Peptidase A4 family
MPPMLRLRRNLQYMRNLARGLCVAALLVVSSSSVAMDPVVHNPRYPAETPPREREAGWSASNWSGYAISGSKLNSITGSWTIQSVAPSKTSTYSSQWIGIDGFSNSSLIQTGTESDFANGRASYRAWWEILPAAETVISSITVLPGDHVSASISQTSGGLWVISITDDTTGQSFSTMQTYSGPQTSGEWIEEAPTIGGRVASLANYGLTTFDPGTLNGQNPQLTVSEGGVMIQKRIQVSTPSAPDGDADGFNMRYGATPPLPPAS